MAAFAGHFGEDSAEVELLRCWVCSIVRRREARSQRCGRRRDPGSDGASFGARRSALGCGCRSAARDRAGRAGEQPCAGRGGRASAGAGAFRGGAAGEASEAWRAGHARLYEHFKALPEKEQPDTLEEMAPLFQAVFHGCQAGRHQEALDEVYWARIFRGEKSTSRRSSAHLAPIWRRWPAFLILRGNGPVASITEADQAFVLKPGRLSTCARSGGFRRRSRRCGRRSTDVGQEHWHNAAIAAGNLSELQLTLGEVAEAIALAEQSVDYADRSGDAVPAHVQAHDPGRCAASGRRACAGRSAVSGGGAAAGGMAARIPAALFAPGLSVLRSAARPRPPRRGPRPGDADAIEMVDGGTIGSSTSPSTTSRSAGPSFWPTRPTGAAISPRPKGT